MGVATWSTHVVSPVIYRHLVRRADRFRAGRADDRNAADAARPRRPLPANNLKGLVGWLKAASRLRTSGRRGRHRPGRGLSFPEGDRHAVCNTCLIAAIRWRSRICSAGRIDLLFDQPSDAVPQHRDGGHQSLCGHRKDRVSGRAEVPTVDEAGLPGHPHDAWHSLWVPKGTPAAIIARLNAATDGGARRSGRAQAACRHRPESGAAPSSRRRPRSRLLQGRDRQMVADHQGCRHQAGMSRRTPGENQKKAWMPVCARPRTRA